MENFNFLPVFFQSIPESIILLSTSLTLFGYKVKNNLRKVMFIGIINSLFLMIIRAYFPFGFHTLFGLVFLSFSLWKQLKINIVKSFIITAFGITILGVLESIFVPVLLQVFDLTMEKVLSQQSLRIIIAYPHLFTLTIISMVAHKTNWHLIDLDSVIISKSNFALIIIVLLHMLFLAFFNLSHYLYEIDILFNALPFINLFIVTSLILSILLIKRLFLMAEGEATMKIQEQHFKNVDDLFNSYRAIRHDFNNHIQAVYGMIAASGNSEATTYLDSILDEYDELNELMRLKHSALAALLKAKIALTTSKGINFHCSVHTSLENIKIKPHELVNIVGNLIDNAIDAVEDLEAENRYISLQIMYIEGYFSLMISNFGVIEKHLLQKIFKETFTTKDISQHSGLGLSTVKKLVTKNKGEIRVKSSPETGTVFTVMLPAKEEA